MRSLSLAGADRFRTTSCRQRNAVSASRAARDLNSPTGKPLSSCKRSSIPKTRIADLGICASPDTIFGSHRRGCTSAVTARRRVEPADRHRCTGPAIDLHQRHRRRFAALCKRFPNIARCRRHEKGLRHRQKPKSGCSSASCNGERGLPAHARHACRCGSGDRA